MQFVFAENKLLIPAEEELKDGLEVNVFQRFNFEQNDIVSYTHPSGQEHHFVDLQYSGFDDSQWKTVSLRDVLMAVGEDEYQPVALAWQYAEFLKTHQFCGKCGSKMHRVHWEMAMHCHSCQHRCYPRVSPCIIVAIYKQDKLLLAQGVRHQKTGFYSTLAGFVESAESLENAVHREVFEEVGVKIKNLEYFGSQPWPFPHSLMCGYIAEYESGDIVVDEKEILTADFFDVDNLPKTPPKVSIAGHLIEETVRRIKSKK